MLNIYYARESVDKEKFIFDTLKGTGQIRHSSTGFDSPRGSEKAGRTILLVPDQYTLEAEQQAFRHLKAEGLMDMEVLSMSRLGSRLIAELGGAKQTFIDKYGRHMILARIARENREKLQVFRGLEERNSFIEMVNNFISELKQYNCGTAEMEAMAAEAGEGSYTRRKLEDLTLLYRLYEEEIRGKYTDSEDYIDLYLSKIPESKLVEGSRIWIYGFDSFAPKALAVIGQLMARAAEVNAVLTWDGSGADGGQQSRSRDSDLFALTGMVMENLEDQARAVGVEVCRKPISTSADSRWQREDVSPAIAHIEKELYTLPSRTCTDCEGITLVAAAGLYNEAESAAAYVLQLVREKGLKYRDIRLVCNDQETRGPILERVFQEYGIPVFSDGKKDILSSPVVQYVLALLDAAVEGYRTEDVFRVLKSGFGPLEREEVTDLENYAIKYRVRRTMWKRPFAKGVTEYGDDGLARLEDIRQRAMAPVLALEPLLKGSDGSDAGVPDAAAVQTTAAFIEHLYQYLYETVCLPDRILDYISRQEEMGRVDLADETGQIWGHMIGILDQMMEIMGGEPFDAETFLDIFRVGLSQVEVGVLPPTRDGLLMGTMQRTRVSQAEALVVVGANEGVLPQEKPEAGLFSTEEKELFRERGAELCKVDAVVLMEERLAVYRNLSRPSKYLWISHSLSDVDGKESKPSSVYLKMKELFPLLQEQRDVLNETDGAGRHNPLPLIHSGLSSLRHLTEALQDVTSAGGGEHGANVGSPAAALDGTWKETLAWYQEHQPEQLETIANGLAFTNTQEALGKEAARQLFLRNPEAAISLSPSRLEKFSRCPFSHFVSYGLRPEERRIFEVAPREIGDIYHECLMTLAQTLTRPDLDVTHPLSPWMTVTRQECGELVRKTARQQMELYREGLFHLGKEESYRSQRIYDICEKVCWTVVEQVRAGQIEGCDFEVGFRRGGKIAPVALDIGGEAVYIEGKIDRVDWLPGDRVKIIDYKTGNENFSIAEAKAGYRLQLMLYLAAACEEKRKPAGVFYFKITEPMVDTTGKELDPEELAKEIRKNFKLNGVMVDDPQVIQAIAGDFSGFSDIVPLRAGKEKISGTGKENLISEEDFAQLRDAVTAKTVEICRNLAEGHIDIHPMKTKERSACTYCEYKGICRFDTVFEGCGYNIIS